jgi:hypothetical protein
MNMEGKIMWKTGRAPAFDKGSMIFADGIIIATDGQKNLYLIEPDSTVFKPLAKAEILGSKSTGDPNSMTSRIGGSTQNWAPIALAEGRLLIRDQGKMMCVKVVH